MRMRSLVVGASVGALVVASLGGVALADEVPGPDAEPEPEEVALVGQVTDTLTGAPIAGVTVHLHRVEPEVGPGGPMVSATTDADGRYEIVGREWLDMATHVGIHQGVPGYEQLWRFIRWDGSSVPFVLDLDLYPTSDPGKVLVEVVDAVTGAPVGVVDAFLHYVEPDASPIPFLPFTGPSDTVAYHRVEAGRDLFVEAWAEGYLPGISEVASWDGATPTRLVVELQPRSVDVPVDAVHAPGIDWLVASGYAAGYADGTFRPAELITRAQMATLLTNVFELEPGDETFVDVSPGSTHERSISALVAAGISSGYADETFRPGMPVLRAHMASFLASALELEPVATDLADVSPDSPHAGAIGAVVAAGIAQGYDDGTFRPNEPMTRAQMATLLYQALGD